MRLLLGDCLDKLKELDDNSVDSIVTDPPYGIAFMGKKWDYDVPSQAIWEECMRVLKPGGHILSFAGSRTYHRMAVRIEDAGFEIRDQIMWIYGSGFPKSHNIGKAVDKIGGKSIGWFGQWLRDWREENNITQKEIAKLFPSKTGGLTGCVANWELGLNIPTTEQFNTIIENFDLPFENIEELEREIVGTKNSACFGNEDRHTIGASKSVEVDITKGNSDWEGWGTALKPAHEPIVMARKPIVGTVANNVLEYGVGGINIDECRIGVQPNDDIFAKNPHTRGGFGHGDATIYGDSSGADNYDPTKGRFPANIIFDEEAGRILDEQSGISKSSGGSGDKSMGALGKNGKYGNYALDVKAANLGGLGDTGGASRFFYCPKTSKSDRSEGNIHPTVKPTDLMGYLIRLVTPKGGIVLDPFMVVVRQVKQL